MVLLSEQDKVSLKARITSNTVFSYNLLIMLYLDIISVEDLSTITAKSIRKQIESEDSKNYDAEKAFFAETIKECLEKRIQNDHSKKISIGNNDNLVFSQDTDYEMALKLQQQEESRSNRSSLRRRASGTNRKYQEGLIIKSSKRKNDANSISGIVKPKSRTILNKPLLLSSELSAVFDNQFVELSRPEVIKKIWDYIKKEDLQDPADRRFILCDEKLMKVFNRQRINCFKMAKFMSAHLHRKEDLSDSVAVQSSRKDSKGSRMKDLKSNPISPKKQKISDLIVQDSDEEADEYLKREFPMHPLLVQIPGVTPEMSYIAVQAAVLSYIEAMKLRNPNDTDFIIIKPGTPIAKLMSNPVENSVHALTLIKRVRLLFDHKDDE